MNPASPPSPPATLEDWLAIPEEKRAELIDGQIIYQAMPGPRHGRSQGSLFADIRYRYDRKLGDPERPGGWWLSQEVDMAIGGIGCRPDLLGWRRDKHPTLPEPDARGLTVAVPDWICEVLSPSTAHVDWGKKRLAYHRAGVAHYWLLDYIKKTLMVLRWTPDGYVIALAADVIDAEAVHAEPFEAVALELAQLVDDT